MTTTQDSTEDWLSGILREFNSQTFKTAYEEHSGRIVEFAERSKGIRAVYEAKIRQHMLSEALELIGEDDNEVRGTTQSPDNPNYWTKRTKHRNELKAELRQAFTEKYGERE